MSEIKPVDSLKTEKIKYIQQIETLKIMIYKINGNYAFFSSYNMLSSTACFGGHQGRESGKAHLGSGGWVLCWHISGRM